MSNPSVVSLQLAAAVIDGVRTAQIYTAPFVGHRANGGLAVNNVAIFDVPRRVLVTSAGNDLGITFYVGGRLASGAPMWEGVPGTNAGSAYTKNDFASVNYVGASGASASTVQFGTTTVASTRWVLDNFLAPNWALSVWVSIVSGSATYTVEDTPDDPNTQLAQVAGWPSTNRIALPAATQASNTAQPQQFSMEPASFVPPAAWANPFLTGLSANAMASYNDRPVFAHRLTITSGTGLVVMQSIQSGIGST